MNATTTPEIGARFTTGSILHHVIEMTITGAIGLMAVFFVDFLSLFYISRLGDDAMTAGVGFATTLLMLSIAMNIGTMIAASALVARAIGAGDRERTRVLAATSLALSAAFAFILSALMLAVLSPLLSLLGAKGVPGEIAERFLWITLPGNVVFAIGMTCSGLLRAKADPRRAMQVTLIGALVTAVSDPLFIFGFGWGTDGAAAATLLARFVYAIVGLYGVVRVHDLLGRPGLPAIWQDARGFFAIAFPAILTNVATPIASLIVVMILARFGPEALAANAILDRLVPLAFGFLFALSGAVGPILAQNWGARRFDRVRLGLRQSLLLALGYSALAALALFLARDGIVALFAVEGATARYVAFFCLVGGIGWVFNGGLFVANAAFNNLGFALYSTAFNWGRATFGTLPFALIGAHLGGVEGVITGVALGSALFSIAAIVTAFRAIDRLEVQAAASDQSFARST